MLQRSFTDYAQVIQIKPDSPALAGQDVVAALHDLIVSIRENLPAEKKHFLKYRSPEQIAEHFASGNLVFGAVDYKGKLVACVMLSDLSDPKNHAFYAEHYREENLQQGNWAVHTVGVHPEHTGHKLMAATLNAVEQHTANHPEKFGKLIGKVADTNNLSLGNFHQAGFSPIAYGHDSKGYDYTLVARNVTLELAPAGEMPFNNGYDTSDAQYASPFGSRSFG